MNTYDGKCGCNAIAYSINEKPVNIINCHCDMCKHHNGSAFSTYAIFPITSFKIEMGENLLNRYVANDGVKHFCNLCGTPLFNTHDKYPEVCMVYIGTLNSSFELAPKLNVWHEKQLSWVGNISNIECLSEG